MREGGVAGHKVVSGGTALGSSLERLGKLEVDNELGSQLGVLSECRGQLPKLLHTGLGLSLDGGAGTLCTVNGRELLTLGRADGRLGLQLALPTHALGRHLLLNHGHHVVVGAHLQNLKALDLHTPLVHGRTHELRDVLVDLVAAAVKHVKRHTTNHAAGCRNSDRLGARLKVLHAVTCVLGVKHLVKRASSHMDSRAIQRGGIKPSVVLELAEIHSVDLVKHWQVPVDTRREVHAVATQKLAERGLTLVDHHHKTATRNTSKHAAKNDFTYRSTAARMSLLTFQMNDRRQRLSECIAAFEPVAEQYARVYDAMVECASDNCKWRVEIGVPERLKALVPLADELARACKKDPHGSILRKDESKRLRIASAEAFAAAREAGDFLDLVDEAVCRIIVANEVRLPRLALSSLGGIGLDDSFLSFESNEREQFFVDVLPEELACYIR